MQSHNPMELLYTKKRHAALMQATRREPASEPVRPAAREHGGIRPVAGLVAGGLAVATFFAAQHGLNKVERARTPEPASEELGTYTAQPGDSLSSIAQQIEDNMPVEHDPRNIEARLEELNGGDTSVTVGEGVTVPASADMDPTRPFVQLEPPQTEVRP